MKYTRMEIHLLTIWSEEGVRTEKRIGIGIRIRIVSGENNQHTGWHEYKETETT